MLSLWSRNRRKRAGNRESSGIRSHGRKTTSSPAGPLPPKALARHGSFGPAAARFHRPASRERRRSGATGGQVQLQENVGHMPLDRVLRKAQADGDMRVAEPVGYQ